MHPAHRSLGRVAVALVALFSLVPSLALAGAGRAGAAGQAPSAEPVTAAQYGARWAATQVTAAGFVPGPTNTPNVSATLETAIALASTGVEPDTFTSLMNWLQANVATAIDPYATGDSAGNLGYLLLLARAAGIDPTTFGGQNLPARLAATLGGHTAGMYGATDPTYDGVFRQSLAVLGLHANLLPVPASAVAWLAAQQCDATTPAAAGGFEPFRADTAVACSAPDLNSFTGPDTNSTALAVLALQGSGGFAGLGAALDFLAAAESSAAGFGFLPGATDDPNSTALVLLAIVAGGESPGAGRWVRGGASPLTSLLAWQLDCDAAAADLGAFASPYSAGAPDGLATRQAIWGASGRGLSFGGPVQFQAAPQPCVPASSSTTTTVVPSSTTTTTPPMASAAPAIAPVSATPAYAG